MLDNFSGHFDGWLYESATTADEPALSFYIYSDLTTAIRGTFANGNLIEGRETKIKGFRLTKYFTLFHFICDIFKKIYLTL